MFDLNSAESNLSDNQLSGLRKQVRQINQEKYLELSKQRLNKIISKKTQTCFIGSIAAFEETFGFLWGHDKNGEDLDRSEIKMKELWDNVRTRILNHGNQQLRSMQNEVNNHIVSWQRYKTEFVIRNPDQK